MKRFVIQALTLAVILLAPACTKPQEGPAKIDVPDLEARVVEVSSPKMKIYFPKTNKQLCRLVVACPGGGYSGIPGADTYEGAFYKDLFNEAGYALAVLYYTLPGGDCTKPVNDLEKAIRLVREKAGEWYVDKDQVGVMGFSAGGHLASVGATQFTGESRANFQVLFYPVITMEEGKTHAGSRTNFLGPNTTQAFVDLYSSDKNVTAQTPRTFLTYAESDGTVPPATNGAAYYNALTSNNVPVTRYTYSGSRHGWHWGTVTFDGKTVSDGSKYENLDDIKTKLMNWLVSF